MKEVLFGAFFGVIGCVVFAQLLPLWAAVIVGVTSGLVAGVSAGVSAATPPSDDYRPWPQ